jgi:hypothetical protein
MASYINVRSRDMTEPRNPRPSWRRPDPDSGSAVRVPKTAVCPRAGVAASRGHAQRPSATMSARTPCAVAGGPDTPDLAGPADSSMLRAPKRRAKTDKADANVIRESSGCGQATPSIASRRRRYRARDAFRPRMRTRGRAARGWLSAPVEAWPARTAASRRLVALDRHTVRLLREHRRRQRAEQRAARHAWQDSGYVFVTEDGAPLHPDFLTRRFHHLVGESGLPPVRHARPAARRCESRALCRRRPQDRAGAVGAQQHRVDRRHLHSVLTDLLAYAAEATARLVLAAAARNPGRQHRRNDLPRKSAAPAEVATVKRPVGRPSGHAKSGKRDRPRTSHRRPTKIKGV